MHTRVETGSLILTLTTHCQITKIERFAKNLQSDGIHALVCSNSAIAVVAMAAAAAAAEIDQWVWHLDGNT